MFLILTSSSFHRFYFQHKLNWFFFFDLSASFLNMSDQTRYHDSADTRSESRRSVLPPSHHRAGELLQLRQRAGGARLSSSSGGGALCRRSVFLCWPSADSDKRWAGRSYTAPEQRTLSTHLNISCCTPLHAASAAARVLSGSTSWEDKHVIKTSALKIWDQRSAHEPEGSAHKPGLYRTKLQHKGPVNVSPALDLLWISLHEAALHARLHTSISSWRRSSKNRRFCWTTGAQEGHRPEAETPWPAGAISVFI